ncbi:hypothetical protein THASP1DRAFT_21474 [Thamnocephalis sphaerospora]|uniref:t-SNARE affecting a late Golgi compartment protein 1 n=1 Tax=Thamnocephalis sphaerospora TaxID=78915 RepID=A0A4P9XX33_9FUNG|nr:hypothetical protein THASP1DRAFT_21474 [Thamnocephalis sphaerospora]|eukprot:RKP10864.1 hypothetical protein THASP1DRAFT_21474 [Thamnocephalis sphaerospora]
MSQEDPFLVVKAEVEIALTNADTYLQSWRRIMRTVTSAQSEELSQARQELEECLRNVEDDAVELNPRKFQITPAEMEHRRRFVETTKQTIHSIRESMTARAKEFQEAQARKALLETRQRPDAAGHVAVNMDEERRRNNQDFIQDEQQQQMMIMEQQDVHLDSVLGTVTNLKEVAHVMGRELDDQNVLLEELEGDVDRTQSGIDRATGKVKEILRKSRESRSNCCITILIIVLIILLILVITL